MPSSVLKPLLVCHKVEPSIFLKQLCFFSTLSDPTSLDVHAPPLLFLMWNLHFSFLTFFSYLSGVPSVLACISLAAILTTIMSEPSPSGKLEGFKYLKGMTPYRKINSIKKPRPVGTPIEQATNTKSIHGLVCAPQHICSRGLPCLPQ